MNIKDLIVKPISAQPANRFVKKWHYSGKVVNNSTTHFGVFYGDTLHGVMSFGHSLDKSKVIGLVKDTEWNGFVELNRMAFSDKLPKNSESRCLAVALRLIKKAGPHIRWVVSYADATQSGDGTIYRACGFLLTQIKKNSTLWRNKKSGELAQNMKLFNMMVNPHDGEWELLQGYMLRYIYLLGKDALLTCEVVPYSEIKKMGAGMYLGNARD